MGCNNLFLWKIIPAIVLTIAAFVGWIYNDDVPLGKLFATVIPLMKGVMPPTIVGHGKMSGAPPVPDDLLPKPLNGNDMFLTLPGTNDQFPQTGLGMCCRPTAYDDVLVYRTVLWYLLLGGRHIDGAHLYLNSKAIGRGIQEAAKRGVNRKEIFVTSKIAPTHFGYEKTIETVKSFLPELGLDYIDMVLLHAPSYPSLVPTHCKSEGKTAAQCREETWRALSFLKEKGIIRNAGVSNFYVKHLKELNSLTDAGLAPIANNQIEYNPFVPESTTETIEYCKAHNITITGYFPLGGELANKAQAMKNEILTKLSTKYDKSVSQIMLRWSIQKGVVAIPGTSNPKHMQENLDVVNFSLDDIDVKTIDDLKHSVTGLAKNADYSQFD